jgi:predicted nucleic acid-binding protein
MRLVDTSAWIEWIVDSPLAPELARHLPAQPDWVVPTIVQHELTKWLRREMGEEEADKVIAFTELCIVVPLDTKLAVEAAEIAGRLRLSTADAIICATAVATGAALVTCDGHFADLPGAILIPNRGRPGG